MSNPKTIYAPERRRLVSFSCGAASAVAAKLTIARFPNASQQAYTFHNLLRKHAGEMAKLREEKERLFSEVAALKGAVRFLNRVHVPSKRARKIHHVTTMNSLRRRKWNTRELAFIRVWRKYHKTERRPYLDHILSETPNHAQEISQRDAIVAATVIQWLGTNVGRCFVDEAIAEAGRLDKRKKVKND